ncbi:UNVERIFIED_CONTAM: hypothetical protein GTU68_057247 [Idotea baltica]|nr:hypothetical protein [Idotea baltica]
MSASRQETLSPETSIASSPQRGGSAPHDENSGSYVQKTTVSPGSLSPQLGTPTPFTQSQRNVLHSPPSSPKFINAPKVPPHGLQQDQALHKAGPENSINHDQPSQNHVANRDRHLVNGHEKSASPARISDTEGDAKKRKYPTDRAYFIVKEMLTTERTYKKDLEVINIWFREEVKKEKDVPEEALTQLFLLIDPIYEFHVRFLKDLDNRLAQWDGRSSAVSKAESQKMGDLMMKSIAMLELYEQYFSQHNFILENIEIAFRKNKKFEQLFRDFETQKVCYLPLTSFLLKPFHRLQHYHLLLVRLIQHYGNVNHHDYRECMTAKAKIHQCIKNMLPTLAKSENLVKLMELQRDLVGIDNLVQPGREFLREGCLQKLSRKGYQQRMFFLFNDVLLYTNRTTTPILQFKVHGQLPLRGVMVEENESRMGATNCFTIYGGNRALMVAANSEEDKSRWLEDLASAIALARSRQDDAFHYLSLKSISASDEVLDKSDGGADEVSSPRSEKSGPQTRSNTTVHVCWHRATSVSAKDYTTAVQNQLSGYLLRKFKNSMGWQKLWVVFTNFCLFFYKTFQVSASCTLPIRAKISLLVKTCRGFLLETIKA